MKLICRTILLFAVTVTSFSLFAQKPTTALELNNYMVTVNDTLYASGKEWGATLNSVYLSKRFDSLTPIRIKMESFIVRKLQELKDMKDIKGSDAFRQAMIDFLAFEAKMMREGFTPLEGFDKESKPEDIKAAIKKLTDLAEQENIQLKKVNTLQTEYAAKNGFTIEKDKR